LHSPEGSKPKLPITVPVRGRHGDGNQSSQPFSHAPIRDGEGRAHTKWSPPEKWSRTPWHKAHGADTPTSPPFFLSRLGRNTGTKRAKIGRSYDLKTPCPAEGNRELGRIDAP